MAHKMVLRSFLKYRIINYGEVKSVEVYSKSMIPPLVTSILLTVTQLAIFFGLKEIDPLNIIIEHHGRSILIICNILIITSLALAFTRVKMATLKITLIGSDEPLKLHYVLRSTCNKIVESVQASIHGYESQDGT
ncbi:hypothetical protein KEJ51_03115 [Candidatus Bathyarchaeota archaeon]|nr:hypothetical protein [Candidatus Bathyarchaeota archaeon]MBS7629072.1 hypothetical protein [Candidatus Bathyarchaeota archaeon]